jgi:hypothetical protein
VGVGGVEDSLHRGLIVLTISPAPIYLTGGITIYRTDRAARVTIGSARPIFLVLWAERLPGTVYQIAYQSVTAVW